MTTYRTVVAVYSAVNVFFELCMSKLQWCNHKHSQSLMGWFRSKRAFNPTVYLQFDLWHFLQHSTRVSASTLHETE